MEVAMSEVQEGLHVDECRLVAILAADVAGYSRLMGRDEAATVRDLEAHKAAILPIIARHGGSIINIAGDGVVAQFPSAVRAVECAVAVQKIMGERNVDVPKDHQMLLRIGINLGDIIHDADKTYGDGINVAARLEPLAEPGGICISANAARRDLWQARAAIARYRGEDRSRTSTGQCTSIRSNRQERASGVIGSAGLCANIAGSASALGLVVLLAALAGAAAWRFWPRETGRPEIHAGQRPVALHQHKRRQEPRQSRFEIRARSLGDAGDLPDVPDGLRHQACLRREHRTSGDDTRSKATSQKSGDKLRVRAQPHRCGERGDRLVGQLRIPRTRPGRRPEEDSGADLWGGRRRSTAVRGRFDRRRLGGNRRLRSRTTTTAFAKRPIHTSSRWTTIFGGERPRRKDSSGSPIRRVLRSPSPGAISWRASLSDALRTTATRSTSPSGSGARLRRPRTSPE